MIKSFTAKIEGFLPSGCKLIHGSRSRLGGTNYRFEVRASDRDEVRDLAQDLVARVGLLPDPPFGTRRAALMGISWYAKKQTYRFTIRVWVEVEQPCLPGLEAK